MALNLKRPWWETDGYTVEDPIPSDLTAAAGPRGLALVKAFASGQTQEGWGLIGRAGSEGFMERYEHEDFQPRRALYGYKQGTHGFAFVLRSARLLCVDIDGKNGGLEFAPTLGNLPYTLSETSKSGTGYHLWYETDESWDDYEGFGELPDQIGIVQGVDIRAVGCVFHWPQQRWNTRPIAPLPEWLRERLEERRQQRLAAASRITATLASQDPEEIMMLQAELQAELDKSIPAGRRNTTLFAVGHKMRTAGISGWEELIRARAAQLKLDATETDQVIRNIGRYDA